MRKFIGSMLVFFVFFLTACGMSESTESRITFRKDGGVEAVYVTAFPEEQYSAAGLEEEALEAVEAYNSAAGRKRVRIKGVAVQDGTARVRMRYKSAEDYAAFNHQLFYSGSLADALKDGVLSPGMEVRSPDGKRSAELGVLAAGEDRETLEAAVLEESAVIEHPGIVLYMSSNVSVDEDGTVRTDFRIGDKDTEAAVIIYKH